MAVTDINGEDRLVQTTFAEHLEKVLGWESIYAYNAETFGLAGTLGRASERDVVLVRDLRAALARLNPDIPEAAREQAVEKLTRIDFARSLIQHNREIYSFIRGGVPVEWKDAAGETRHAHAHVIDFRNAGNNRFLAVRELKMQGVRVPHYNRRADLVCFVNVCLAKTPSAPVMQPLATRSDGECHRYAVARRPWQAATTPGRRLVSLAGPSRARDESDRCGSNRGARAATAAGDPLRGR